MRLTLERLKEITAALHIFDKLMCDFTLARDPGNVKVAFRGAYIDEWADSVRQLVLDKLREKIRTAVSVLDSLGLDVSTLDTKGVLDE